MSCGETLLLCTAVNTTPRATAPTAARLTVAAAVCQTTTVVVSGRTSVASSLGLQSWVLQSWVRLFLARLQTRATVR